MQLSTGALKSGQIDADRRALKGLRMPAPEIPVNDRAKALAAEAETFLNSPAAWMLPVPLRQLVRELAAVVVQLSEEVSK